MTRTYNFLIPIYKGITCAYTFMKNITYHFSLYPTYLFFLMPAEHASTHSCVRTNNSQMNKYTLIYLYIFIFLLQEQVGLGSGDRYKERIPASCNIWTHTYTHINCIPAYINFIHMHILNALIYTRKRAPHKKYLYNVPDSSI